jgi:hypothetical protein
MKRRTAQPKALKSAELTDSDLAIATGGGNHCHPHHRHQKAGLLGRFAAWRKAWRPAQPQTLPSSYASAPPAAPTGVASTLRLGSTR